MANEAEGTGEKSPRIKRGTVDSLTLHEVTDHELDLLERGSPSSTFLNFAVALLTTSASFLVALLTATIPSTRTFAIFVVVVAVGAVSGVVLLVVWWRTRQSASTVVAQIRSRVPADESDPNEEESG